MKSNPNLIEFLRTVDEEEKVSLSQINEKGIAISRLRVKNKQLKEIIVRLGLEKREMQAQAGEVKQQTDMVQAKLQAELDAAHTAAEDARADGRKKLKEAEEKNDADLKRAEEEVSSEPRSFVFIMLLYSAFDTVRTSQGKRIVCDVEKERDNLVEKAAKEKTTALLEANTKAEEDKAKAVKKVRKCK